MAMGKSVFTFFTRLTDAKPSVGSLRKYCKVCGTSIPYESVYCQNCGAVQGLQPVASEPLQPRGGVAEALKGRRHIYLSLFFISLTIFIIAFIFGSNAKLPPQNANAIINDFQNSIPVPSAWAIFKNNFTICLLFFIPLFGTAFVSLVGYNTGVVLAAVHIVNPSSPSAITLAIITLVSPWTWFELPAYAVASSTGLMMIVSALRRSFRKDSKSFLLALAVSIVLLAIGAIIEGYAIATIT